jgi:hypothetical protein
MTDRRTLGLNRMHPYTDTHAPTQQHLVLLPRVPAGQLGERAPQELRRAQGTTLHYTTPSDSLIDRQFIYVYLCVHSHTQSPFIHPSTQNNQMARACRESEADRADVTPDFEKVKARSGCLTLMYAITKRPKCAPCGRLIDS